MPRSKIPDIRTYIKARFTALWIPSIDEMRITGVVAEAARAEGYKVLTWDCVDGLMRLNGDAEAASMQDPEIALRWLRTEGGPREDERQPSRVIVVFRDIHRWLQSPTTVRLLRSTAQDLQAGFGMAVCLVTPDAVLPEDLTAEVTKINWPLPGREEVGAMLDDAGAAFVATLQSQNDSAEDLIRSMQNGRREKIIDAALGLSAEQIQQAFAYSFADNRSLNPDLITAEKATVIAGIKGLTWWEPDPNGMNSLGGMQELKNWAAPRAQMFGERARKFGLPTPKGALLLGVQGCGKSHAVKCLATAWGMPLIAGDLGAMKGKYVGDSEASIRKALSIAEVVAPCILMFDEIEKALGGSAGDSGDGGVSSDQLGAVLTWLQEKTAPVFVVCTSNDISRLPPELLRKGRFDEIFFVDLPTYSERAEILSVCAKRYNREVTTDVAVLDFLQATDGFSGAEIQAAVESALLTAFGRLPATSSDPAASPLLLSDIISAANVTQPLSKTAAEKIEKLREWAVGRTRPVAAVATTAAQKSGEQGPASTMRRRVIA